MVAGVIPGIERQARKKLEPSPEELPGCYIAGATRRSGSAARSRGRAGLRSRSRRLLVGILVLVQYHCFQMAAGHKKCGFPLFDIDKYPNLVIVIPRGFRAVWVTHDETHNLKQLSIKKLATFSFCGGLYFWFYLGMAFPMMWLGRSCCTEA
jgi:hypothetical protein